MIRCLIKQRGRRPGASVRKGRHLQPHLHPTRSMRLTWPALPEAESVDGVAAAASAVQRRHDAASCWTLTLRQPRHKQTPGPRAAWACADPTSTPRSSPPGGLFCSLAARCARTVAVLHLDPLAGLVRAEPWRTSTSRPGNVGALGRLRSARRRVLLRGLHAMRTPPSSLPRALTQPHPSL